VRCAGCVSQLIFLVAASLTPLGSVSAASFYEQGLQALDARQFTRARELLALAVQENPDHAGAWLDLALAAFGEGDAALADEILRTLTARFGTPQALAPIMAQLRHEIDARLAPVGLQPDGWQPRLRVQLAGGVDSNANAGLAASDIALTLPQGSIVLPLNPTLRERSDTFLTGLFALSARRNMPVGVIEPEIQVRARRNQSVTEFNTREVNLGLSWVVPLGEPALGEARPAIARQMRFQGLSQNLWLGGQALLRSLQVGAEHQWAGRVCGPAAGASLDDRHFPDRDNLDSRLAWASLRLNCLFGLEDPHGRMSRASAYLRNGQEAARTAPSAVQPGVGRTGGDTRHVEAGLAYSRLFPQGWLAGRLDAELVWARAKDSEGYSVLLQNNARREMNRGTLNLAYSIPLKVLHPQFMRDPGELSLSWQAFRQDSNLQLFRANGQQITVGVIFGW
jgi:hypothetical protein